MRVTFVDESVRDARRRVERVLDRYLPRVAQATWTGFLSNEALRTVAGALRARASRNTAVACFVSGRNNGAPVFHIGSRHRFGRRGQYAINVRQRRKPSRTATPGFRQLKACLEMAALLHDVGKSAHQFQRALRKAGENTGAVRHELISTLFLIETSRAFDDADALWRALAGGPDAATLEAAYERAAARAARLSPGDPLPELHWDGSRPALSAVVLLIAVHHRLLEAELTSNAVSFHTRAHVRGDASQGPHRAREAAHADAPSVFRDDRFRRRLQRAAAELRDAFAAPTALTPDTAYAYGRLCLMLGDQDASARGQQRVSDDDGELFANTSAAPERPGALAEPLVDHLKAVAHRTRAHALMLQRSQHAFPRVTPDALPEALTAPPCAGRFAWQGDAVERLRGHEARGAGFFGVAIVPTGGGKTRGAPAALHAATGRCRFVLGLGLRSLTLQSGTAYTGEVGFASGDVATIIGDETARRLHELDRAGDGDRAGTNAEAPAVDDLVVAGGAGRAAALDDAEDRELDDAELAELGGDPDRALPHTVETALQGAWGRERADRLLRTPVVAATVDQLMAAADARSSRYLHAMLRLATSDLILDEIDAYDAVDDAAILRLVYLAGVFGRAVVLASATTPPEIARAFHRAYAAGYSAHAALTDGADRVLTAWLTDDPTLTTVEAVDSERFGERHRAVTERFVQQHQQAPARRFAEIVTSDEAGETAAFDAMIGAARRMHHRHAQAIDDGVRVSVGVVRVANVRTCRDLARHIARSGIPDTIVGVACYHARLLGLVRFHTERMLDEMLVRKGPNGATAPARHPRVRALIDAAKARGVREVMVLVVATPVEETGRDHDYDYAVLEPSSTRSIIQLAGRVGRHRDVVPDAPNIAILQTPLSYARGDQSPHYKRPGVETPFREGVKGATPANLSSAKIDELIDAQALRTRIDGRFWLLDPWDGVGELPAAEHRLLRSFLETGSFRAARFASDPDLPFTAWMPRHQPFRLSDVETAFFLDLEPGAERAWRVVSDHDPKAPHTGLVEETETSFANAVWLLLDLDLDRAFSAMQGTFPGEARTTLCRKLLGLTVPGDLVVDESRKPARIEHEVLFGADRVRGA